MLGVSAVGWAFLFLITFWLPFAAVRNARQVREAASPPGRGQYIFSVCFVQAFTAGTALAAARFDGLELFPAYRFQTLHLALGLAFLVPTLATLPMRWNWRTVADKRRSLWRLPNTSRDLGWWLLVSLAAGVCEEIVFRGVLVQLWQRLLGAWWPAALLCAAVFALAHLVQGWRSVAVIFVLAVANHLIVLATGDLYTAMAIHVVYDFLAGVIFIGLIRREKLLVQGSENTDKMEP